MDLQLSKFEIGNSVIADYEFVKKSSFVLLEIKLWLKEGDGSLTDHSGH